MPGQDQGELAQDSLPVEAAARELIHGLHARVVDLLEADERGEALGAGGGLGGLRLERLHLGFAVADLLVEEAQREHAGEGQDEDPDDHVGHRAGAARAAGAASLLARQQVDGAHAYSSSARP